MTGIQTTLLGQHVRILTPLLLWIAPIGLGLFFLLLAAAGPQCGERTELVKRTGIDLVVALDASNSMLARDVKPSRIERSELEVMALLERLNGDRVGLVVFAGDAFTQCPLTADYAAARMFLRAEIGRASC